MGNKITLADQTRALRLFDETQKLKAQRAELTKRIKELNDEAELIYREAYNLPSKHDPRRNIT